MVKFNPEYLRHYELCKRMAHHAKVADQKLVWLDLAAKWFALAQSPHRVIRAAKIAAQAARTAARPSGPPLHLKKFAG